jgi:hypothetical protein
MKNKRTTKTVAVKMKKKQRKSHFLMEKTNSSEFFNRKRKESNLQ